MIMKNIKNYVLLICVAFLMTTTVIGQHITSLKYNVGFPTADLSDYIGETSWRGISFDYTYLLNDNLGVGIGVAWQTFYEEPGYTTEIIGTETISGTEYRYVNSFPGHVTATYRFSPYSTLAPFVSMGVGTVYNMQDTDIGSFRFEDDAWHFSLRPELGLQFTSLSDVGIQLSVRYNYTTNSGDLGNMSYLALALGFSWESI